MSHEAFCRLPSVLRVLSAGALLWGSPVVAQSGEAMGDPGQILATGSVTVQNVSVSGYSSSATSVYVSGGVHVFVAGDLVIGADLQVGLSSTGPVTAFALLPAVGYNVRLTPTLSLLPQFEASFEIASQAGTIRRLALGGFLPLMVHPPGHFFVGVGPEVLADVSTGTSGLPYSAAKNTVIGIRSVIGAWF